MDYSVVQASLSHAEAIAHFNQAMALETESKHLAPEIILNGVRKMVQDESLGFYLVAETDGSTVGCLGVTYEWSDWRNGLFWWVQSVYVEPAVRGHGVFSAMYEHVKQLAGQNEGVCGIRLYVEKDNQRATRTYEKLGMIETEYRIMEEEFAPAS